MCAPTGLVVREEGDLSRDVCTDGFGGTGGGRLESGCVRRHGHVGRERAGQRPEEEEEAEEEIRGTSAGCAASG